MTTEVRLAKMGKETDHRERRLCLRAVERQQHGRTLFCYSQIPAWETDKTPLYHYTLTLLQKEASAWKIL